MTFAEIILRIGGAVGGWLIFAGHCLTLAVLPQADCDPGSEELWRGTLLFAAASAVGLIFVGRGLQWAHSLRWLGAASVALALLAGYAVFPGLASTTFGAESLCAIADRSLASLDGLRASGVERSWPVLQLLVLGFGVAQAARTWLVSLAPESDAAA